MKPAPPVTSNLAIRYLSEDGAEVAAPVTRGHAQFREQRSFVQNAVGRTLGGGRVFLRSNCIDTHVGAKQSDGGRFLRYGDSEVIPACNARIGPVIGATHIRAGSERPNHLRYGMKIGRAHV